MRRIRLSLLATFLSLALVGGACGGSDKTDTSSKGGDENSSTPSASANDINATPRAQVKQGGTLRWPLNGYPANFNPNELDGADSQLSYIISAILPSPFNFDAAAKPVLNKNYVTSAKVTAETPNQVVTYELNPEAIWYDGTKITVADYVGMWKALAGTNEAYQVVSTSGYEQIKSVEAGKDDHEVIVTFDKPYADWQGLFSTLLPASTSNDPNLFNTGWVDKPLTTAGPFKLDSVDATAKTVTIVPNEKWWGDKPKLDKIVFPTIEDDAQIDALANGEIDLTDIGPDASAYQRAKGVSGVTVHRAGGPNFRHITINGTGPILSDLNVRRALALTIDRTTIAKAMIGPLGGTVKELNNHIFMSNQDGYQDNSGEFTKPNPTKAAQLLDAAGWKLESGQTVRTKDGKKLELRIVIPSQVTTSEQESKLMASMLEKVGIKLNIDTVPSDDFFDKYVTPGDFDLTVFSWLGTTFPISSAKSIYAKPAQGPEGLDIQQNYARIGTDELDALFDEANAEFDATKAQAIGNRIDAMIWKEVHSLTEYQRPDLVATKSTLANYGALGFATAIYENIGFTK